MAWYEKRGDKTLVGWREPNGRKRRRTFTRKTDARTFKREIERDLELGQYASVSQRKVSFGEYAESILDASSLRESTLVGQRSTLRTGLLPISGLPLPAITPASVRDALSALPEGSRRLHAYKLMSKVFKTAVAEGLLSRDPLAQIPRPKTERREIVPLTRDQVRTLHQAYRPGWSIAVLLGAFGGLRGGEAGGLRIQDVDLKTRRLTVHQSVGCTPRMNVGPPKGGRSRTFTIPTSLAAEIEQHLRWYGTAEDGRLIHDDQGLIGTRQLHAALKDAWAKMQMKPPPPRFHDLRHACASFLISSGVHPRRVQDVLGHANIIETMNTYGHLMKDEDVVAADALDSFLSVSD